MSYDQELAFAKKLALEAGEIMLKYFKIGISTNTKQDNTVVTIADKTINSLVIERINATFPDHAILGEEESDLRDGAEYVWVCDPIDGTLPYTMGVPTNVFAITLTYNGTPQIAVAYDPYLERLFWAERDNGSYMNGERLGVNKTQLVDAIIGCSSRRSKIVDSLAVHTTIEQDTYRNMTFGSTIYEGLLVAAGQIAGNIYVGFGAHDCAAKLIVEEAGGTVTDLYGNDQRYDQIVSGMLASNGVIHDELVAIMKQNYLES